MERQSIILCSLAIKIHLHLNFAKALQIKIFMWLIIPFFNICYISYKEKAYYTMQKTRLLLNSPSNSLFHYKSKSIVQKFTAIKVMGKKNFTAG